MTRYTFHPPLNAYVPESWLDQSRSNALKQESSVKHRTWTIKDHIDAGHYPTDSKGRALVPTRGRGIFVVAATDKPGLWPIAGWYADTGDTNSYPDRDQQDEPNYPACLLPPPSAKVLVRRWGVIRKSGAFHSTFDTEATARHFAGREGSASYERGAVVELTGEYERPWS